MTIEEKREAMQAECDSRSLCTDNNCPLYAICELECDFDDDSFVEKYYPILCGQPIADNVNHPNHYNQGEIECIDAMLAAYGKDAVNIFCLLNAFKYLWRAEHKNGNEDLDKAIWYLKKRLELCSDE